MKHHHRIQKHRFAKTYASSGPLCVLLVVAIAFLGCTRDKGGKSAETKGGKTEDAESGEFELGDLVESFDPPELAELEKTVEWRDMPVVDSLELMRERQANETPLATVEEALELRNDSAENNAKIVSALGRVAKDVSEANENAEWLRHTSGDVKSTNPLMSSSAAEADVNGLTSIGMFGFDWNFNPHAGADSVVTWQTSKDGLYDKVIMRDDMTWSDGKPVTAHDVEFSYKVIMSSQVPVPAVRSGTDQLKWVQAYDDHTVVFFHKEPMATNIWNINFSIIPKHIFEKSIAEDPTLSKSPYHVQQDEIPVTGGAYVIKKRQRGQEIVLTRRESYYMHDGKQVRDKPYFKDVRFKIITDPNTSLLALKKGEIEEMTLTPEQWQTQTNDDVFYANNTKVYGLEWVFFYFGWNCKTPYFSDKRVRKAMSYAFDHEEMLAKHRFGMDEACTGIYHNTSRWAPKPAPEPYTQDLKKAEQLLEEAGWVDSDSDGTLDKDFNGKRVPFEFTILVVNRPDSVDLCSLLRENLDKIGIVCQVRPIEFTVLQERTREHQFQAYFGGWGTGADPDTSENLWATNAIENGRNFSQYSNPEVDRLFEKGKRELDLQKRAAIYAKIHMILWEDQPYTWLYFRNAYYAFNKDLRGYNFSPRGPYTYGPGSGSIFKPAMAGR